MDARITKQRLGNFLAYDWLKIVAAIVAAAVVLTVFFTMVGTTPTNAQTFTVISYGGLTENFDFDSLGTSLEESETFSYDILQIKTQSFGNDGYSATVYSARRAAGEGTVLLVADTPEYDENGALLPLSTPLTALSGRAYKGTGSRGSFEFYDTEYFFGECKTYLTGFFGDGFGEESALDTSAAKESFLARNGKDNRFRSSAKKEAGIRQENERLLSLRDDYLFVMSAFEEGILSHVCYETENGEFAFGLSLAGISRISDLVYYDGEGVPDASPIACMIYCNDYGAGNDLRFETVSFLRYLITKYGA